MKEPTILNNMSELSSVVDNYFNENFIHYYGHFQKMLPHDAQPLVFDRFGQRIEVAFDKGRRVG